MSRNNPLVLPISPGVSIFGAVKAVYEKSQQTQDWVQFEFNGVTQLVSPDVTIEGCLAEIFLLKHQLNHLRRGL